MALASRLAAAFAFVLLIPLPALADAAAIERVFNDWRTGRKVDNAILIVEDKGRSLFRKEIGRAHV